MRTNLNEIKSGKMQYNVTSAKEFRTTLAKWHNADFELAEEILRKSDRVNSFKGLIASNNDLIAKLEKGEKIIGSKNVDELKLEIANWESQVKKENDNLAEYRKAQAERYEGARNLLNKELHKAYEKFILDKSAENRHEYIVALANWFETNGLEPALESLDAFASAVGGKRNSARQKIKTGKHNGAMSYTVWRDIFLGEICDVMGDALPLYKFTYVLKENRKKKDA